MQRAYVIKPCYKTYDPKASKVPVLPIQVVENAAILMEPDTLEKKYIEFLC